MEWISKTTVAGFALALLPAIVSAAEPGSASGSGSRNFIANPSFEQARADRPQGWRQERFGGEATFSYASVAHTGNHSVMIASEQGADAGWTANVSVEPYAHYRLSGWIKTEAVKDKGGRGALLNVHQLQGIATKAITGDADWTRVETEFDTDEMENLQVNCLLGGWGTATGKAWFDDVRLELVSTRTPPAPTISIDAGAVRERMSENIYSQFIEHLGRCIYGGIWAQMLEDRKFYFPIKPEYRPYTSLQNTPYPVVGRSPWEILGPASAISMSTNRPFVGRHTPRIESGAALRQRDLGVRSGKSYVGYAWLKSGGTAAAEVALAWGEGDQDRQSRVLEGIGSEYRRFDFEFTPKADTDKARFEIRARDGALFVGTVSLMPADNVEGMRADTLALLKELKAPIYRWPGGNFVSGYDWRDGIGDRDRRPPRTNPAWTGVEHNDFGTHEFIRFCELVGANPWITVNTGFGDAYSAAAQLEYCNGAADTLWGRRRTENGAAKPFAVKYWGIGNEMWGEWQLGFMKMEHYILKQNWVVDKMREVDPTIICIGSGNMGPWSLGLLKDCSDHMDFIAEHFYCQERAGLRAHVRQIADNIRRKAEFHRQARRDLPNLAGKDIRIAMTEWNYWYGPHLFGELGTRYFLKDALGIAEGLHEYARQSDIVGSAFYAQTVNVIGCIKTSKTAAALESTGLVLKLYRQHFGELPVPTKTTGLLDAQAAWSADRKTLTIGVVNPTLNSAEIPVELKGAALKGQGKRWQIAGQDPMSYNDPADPGRLTIEETALTQVPTTLKVAPCSITLFAFDAE